MKIVGLVLACMVWSAVLVGCGDDWNDTGRPDTGGTGGGGAPPSSGGTGGMLLTGGGGSGGTGCAVDCVPGKVAPFAGLSTFYIGPAEDAPPCPGVVMFDRYLDLHWDPIACPSCSCSPAACGLPEAMHASAAMCPADGAAALPFDAAAPGDVWDGTCTNHDAIAPGLQCSGVPCVQSLTLAPAVKPCEPQTVGAAVAPPPSWGRVVRECYMGELPSEGCDPGRVCPFSLPPGYSLCLYLANDPGLECDLADYPRKVVAYAKTPKDDRACSPCECGEPSGAGCEALVSVFKDGACSSLLGTYTVTSSMVDGCHDLPAGVALGSKSAVLSVDLPGTCAASGGLPGGKVEGLDPVTLCCQPDPGTPM